MTDKALYFGVVEFDDSPQIFQSMNLNTAPVIFHFPAKGREKKGDQMEFQRFGIDADAMAKFVAERTSVHVCFHNFICSLFIFSRILGSRSSSTKLCSTCSYYAFGYAYYGSSLYASK